MRNWQIVLILSMFALWAPVHEAKQSQAQPLKSTIVDRAWLVGVQSKLRCNLV